MTAVVTVVFTSCPTRGGQQRNQFIGPGENPGRFGPILVRSGRFGPGRFGPISGVSRFGPVRAGRFGPIS